MPLIIPGIISGGLFAFITSFDEVVAVFLASPERRTFAANVVNIREQINPTILAVATLLVILSIILLTVIELFATAFGSSSWHFQLAFIIKVKAEM